MSHLQRSESHCTADDMDSSAYSSDEEAEVASLATMRTLEDPPPAYDDVSRPVSILTNYSDITLVADAQPTSTRPFPQTFNLYYKDQKKWWSTLSFHLGEHADQPCNAIVLTTGWKGTSFTLHQTSDPASPAIARATAESGFISQSIITIPSLPGSGEEDSIERLHFHASLTSVRYSFTFRVPSGTDAKPRVENFEWRITHGAEVRDLEKHAWGWKLVRLDHDCTTDPVVLPSGKRVTRNTGETSDGKEVVAVWADRSRASRNKFGRFCFVGSGKTGELGREWAVMAVVSALRVWQNVKLGSAGGSCSSVKAESPAQ